MCEGKRLAIPTVRAQLQFAPAESLRAPQLQDTPAPIAKLMLACWAQEPDERPDIAAVHRELLAYLQTLEQNAKTDSARESKRVFELSPNGAAAADTPTGHDAIADAADEKSTSTALSNAAATASDARAVKAIAARTLSPSSAAMTTAAALVGGGQCHARSKSVGSPVDLELDAQLFVASGTPYANTRK